MGRVQIIPDEDFSGLGLKKVAPVVPGLGGALQGLWLFGSAWDGLAAAGDDWSGHGRNAAIAGTSVGTNSVTPTVDAWPVLPLTPNQAIGGGNGITVIVVATVPAGTVTTVPLLSANEGAAVPGLYLYALPGADTVRGLTDTAGTDSQVDQAYTPSLIEQRPAIYFGRWNNTAMTISPGVLENGALKYSTGPTATAVSGAGNFRLGRVASGSMIPLHACAIYRGALTDDQISSVINPLRAALADRGVTI